MLTPRTSGPAPSEHSLSINEERLQLLQDATSDGIWDWNALTNEVYWSNNSFRMIGYEPNEFEINFEKWKTLVHPDDLPGSLKSIEQSVLTGEPLDMEYRYHKKDGSLIWVRASGYGVQKDESGRVTRMIGCHIDLSERKDAEKEIRQKNRELEGMNKDLIASNERAKIAIKTKDEFLSIISHELRTPLNPIVGFSELLLEEAKENAEVYDKAKAIHQSSVEMLQLVDDILEYLRIQKHDFKTAPVEVFLQDLIRSCVEKAGPDESFRDRVVTEYAPEDLLPVQESDLIVLDQRMLQLVVVNLLENALTYSDHKRVVVRTGFLKESPDTLRIEVSDQGIGISQDKQKDIFNALYQVDSSYSRPFEGLGLGLAICKKVIGLLGGKIGVVSELDQGSTFWFEIPVQRRNPAEVD